MLVAIYAYEDCFYGNHDYYKTVITKVDDLAQAEDLALQMSKDIIEGSDKILSILHDGAESIAEEEGTPEADLGSRVEELMAQLVEEDIKYEVYHIKGDEDKAIFDFYDYKDLNDFLAHYDNTLVLSL